MQPFETHEDIEDWLEPMGFEAMWDALIPLGLYGPEDRAHCERTLTDGTGDMDTVMQVTKFIARQRLAQHWNLPFRGEVEPVAPPPTLIVVD